MDYSLALMSGTDIFVPECRIEIHQPTIKEISIIGEDQYLRAGGILTAQKEDMEHLQNIQEINNFMIFMSFISEHKDDKKLIQNVLVILFPKYKILFTPRSICFNLDGETIIINEENFDVLQQVLQQIFCINRGKSKDFAPKGKKAKEIAEKLKRARQRVAAQKNVDRDAPTLSSYISVLAVGLHLSILEISRFTMFQVYDLVERYSLYTNWDIDIRAKLAGSTSETKVENWMKVLH